MKKKKLIFCFDIDNTICSTKNMDYKTSKPNKKIINKINKLFDQGHVIKIYTARYMGKYKDNYIMANKKGYKKIKSQLRKWGLKFNELFFKPHADFYVDDRFINFKRNWHMKLNKYIEIKKR